MNLSLTAQPITQMPSTPSSGGIVSSKLTVGNPGGLVPGGITNQNLVPSALRGAPITSITPPAPIASAAVKNPDVTKPINAVRLASPEAMGKTYSVAIPSTTAQTALATIAGAHKENIIQGQAAAKEAEAQATKAGVNEGTGSSAIKGVLASILSLNEKLGAKGARTAQVNEEQGIAQKQKIAKGLESQYLSVGKSYDDQIETMRKNAGGADASTINANINELSRQKNSELTNIAIQQKIANDDYQGAAAIAEAQIKAEFEPMQAQLDNYAKYIQLASDDMTESEKLQATQEFQKKQDELNFEQQKKMAYVSQAIRQSDPLYQQNLIEATKKNQMGGGNKDDDIAQAIMDFQKQMEVKSWAGANPIAYEHYKSELISKYGNNAGLELDKKMESLGISVDKTNI